MKHRASQRCLQPLDQPVIMAHVRTANLIGAFASTATSAGRCHDTGAGNDRVLVRRPRRATRTHHVGTKRNAELLREALQEMWLGLLHTQPPNEVAADLQRLFAWLLVAVRRRMVDMLRRERLRKHYALEDTRTISDDTSAETVQHESLERVRSVLDALASNAESDARLLKMRYYENRSVAQIAEALGVTARVVSARLQRAKRKFRERWLRAGGGDCSG